MPTPSHLFARVARLGACLVVATGLSCGPPEPIDLSFRPEVGDTYEEVRRLRVDLFTNESAVEPLNSTSFASRTRYRVVEVTPEAAWLEVTILSHSFGRWPNDVDSTLPRAFRRMEGQTFRLHIAPDGRVLGVEGSRRAVESALALVLREEPEADVRAIRTHLLSRFDPAAISAQPWHGFPDGEAVRWGAEEGGPDPRWPLVLRLERELVSVEADAAEVRVGGELELRGAHEGDPLRGVLAVSGVERRGRAGGWVRACDLTAKGAVSHGVGEPQSRWVEVRLSIEASPASESR